jgi:CRP-like cAMP-binding protein
MDSGSGVTGATNRLLIALPETQRWRLMGALSPVLLEPKTVLFEPGQTIDVVDFPRTCVISLVAPLHDGRIVEVASVGNEGIVGVPVVLRGSLAVRAICSVGGWIDRMQATTFTHEIENDVDLHDVVDDYLRAVFSQLSQAVACNRLHSTPERLARWLLASADRLGTDRLPITHEFLGQLLGASQADVSRSAHNLQAVGLISYRRGRFTILDRSGLEAVACECYAVIKAELDGVIRRAVIHVRGRGTRTPARRD